MLPRLIFHATLLLLLSSVATPGASPRLIVRPHGTNELEIMASGLQTNTYYMVMARTNGPGGHWLGLTGFSSEKDSKASLVYSLGEIKFEDLKGLKANSLSNWTFVAGPVADSDGDGLPDLYEELVTRTDPYGGEDGYSDPDGDGWSNIQEMQNGTDPVGADLPAGPSNVSAQRNVNGITRVTWSSWHLPEYFLVEKTDRTLARMTNPAAIPRPPSVLNRSNANELMERRRQFQQRNGSFDRPREPEYVTSPPRIVAKVIPRPDQHDFTYTETNATADLFSDPIYRVRAHFSPPLRAELQELNPSGIRGASQRPAARRTTNGYDLTLTNPIPYFRYLLLVRDRNDSQWRAAGYFTSGKDRNPVQLQVDFKGMMTSPQSPLALPQVRFLTNAVEPEFIAGPGDDNDGDGLPDVYEVLVTKTDPLKTDTGDSGVVDGFKVMTTDGWSNLEKLRRRVDPLRAFHPRAPQVLPEPTLAEALQALTFRTDLPYQPQVEIRIPGTTRFQVVHRGVWLLYGLSGARDSTSVRGCFDLRVSWVIPQARSHEGETEGDGSSALVFSALGAEALQGGGRSVSPGPKKHVALRSEVEAYAATNATFAPAMDYFLATIDGRQPARLPPGMSVQEIEAAASKVFPAATNRLDQPIRFYGKVVDENARPISGFKAHLEWSGILVPGREQADVISDAAGRFWLTNAFGAHLALSLEDSNYYSSARNRNNGTFQYVESVREAFKPDPSQPVIFYFHKKGTGARSLITSQYGVYDDFSVKAPLDGTPLKVNLLQRKTGTGPLEISQVKPEYAKSRTATNWSLTMRIPGGGFVSGGDEEFPFHPPESGYRPEVQFNLDKGGTNWAADIRKEYYIRFGDPPLYGRLRVDTGISSDSVRLSYTVNPDGERNLEPPNEHTLTKAPAPFVAALPALKPKVLFTNASGQVVTWGSMVLPFVKPGTRFTAVAAGGEHSLAVKQDGTVVAWGRNLSGEAKVPAGLSNVIAVSAGGRSGTGFSVALRRDGTVIAWGDNSKGQTNVPPGASDVIAISAGMDHCLALKSDGTVIGWGSKGAGKVQVPPGLSDVVGVAAAGEHSLALEWDGTLVAWGQSQWGQAAGPEGLSNVVAVCSGSDFGLALMKDGSVVQWGPPFSREMGIPNDLTNVATIAAGPWNGLALRRDGAVTAWGRDTFSATHVPPGLNHVVALSCGGNDQGGHTLALKADGSIVAWGNNNYGQSLPPGGLTNVISISGGDTHYLAVRTDGSVIGWGGGERQGDGQALVPPDLGPVKQVSAGWSRSLALRLDGSVAGWGDRFFGLAGPAVDLTNIAAVSAGLDSLALKKDGTVVMWAESPAIRSQPFANAVAIAAAPHHCIALRQDGKVMSSGADETLARSAPADLTNVMAIATWGDPMFDHDLALRRDGTVFSWGSRGPLQQTEMPEHLTNVIAIAAGPAHSLALRRDGTIAAWGANISGQITLPEGLTNIIAIAAAGGSSAAIVYMPETRSPLVSWLRTQAMGKVAVAGVILLLAAGCFRLLRRIA